MPAQGLLDDAVGVDGPDEGFRSGIVLLQIAPGRRLEIDERAQGAPLLPSSGERGEEGFDGIYPGRRRSG
jgi:hypothetical protein